jgi:carboxyl-terminal processing protease
MKKLPLVLLLLFVPLVFAFSVEPQSNPQKQKAIIQAVTESIKDQHFQPKEINDDFSNDVFNLFLQRMDYNKKFFLQSDIDELKKYKNKIDDQINNPSTEFYEATIKIFKQRVAETESFYKSFLDKPFDLSANEEIILDGKKLVYAKNIDELKEAWRKSLKYQVMARVFELDETQRKQIEKKDTSLKIVKSFAELEVDARKKILKGNEDFFARLNKTEADDYFTLYVNTITGVLDPHTDFFPPKDKENFDIRMSGRLEGIGATLQEKDGFIKITSLVVGGPAWKNGKIKTEDLIIKAAEKDDKEWFSLEDVRVDDAVKHIRGKKGTVVRLYVKHADGNTEEVEITRDVVVMDETFAKSSIINYKGKKIGLINLPEFYADFNNPSGRRCGKDMRIEVEKLKNEKVDGIMIDLRNNTGGSLNDVVDIAGLFIKSGPIVQVKSKEGMPYVYPDRDNSVVYDGPLAIMVNEFSASASEILAAAIQDYHRGIIIGSPTTFGKGSVQRFYDLDMYNMTASADIRPLGTIKLTNQKFFRINGGATQLRGVASDIILPDNLEYIEYGEKKEDFPMKWSQIQPAPYTQLSGYFNLDELKKSSKQRLQNNEYFSAVDKNAQRLKKQQDDNKSTLNYAKFVQEQNENRERTKKLEELTKVEYDLNFEMTADDKLILEADTNKVNKMKTWFKALKKDAYIFETTNIVYEITNTAATKRD